MELHFFEINKFQKKPIEEMTRIERWLAYFSNKLSAKELEELGMKDSGIQGALEASDIFMANKEERNAYIRREMAIMDQVSDREGFIQEGFEKGRAEGLAEGFEKGLAEGKEDKNREIAKILTSMIQAGLDDSQISKFTNQSLEKIQQIRENLKKAK